MNLKHGLIVMLKVLFKSQQTSVPFKQMITILYCQQYMK